MSHSGAARSRTWAAIVTGGAACILLLLLLMPGKLASAIGILAVALLGAAVLVSWLGRRGAPPRSAWGAGCLINGLLSTGVALRAQDELWSGRSQYAEDLDRAIGPLASYAAAFVARIGLIAFILAVILFVFSYWLLRPPHRKA